MLDPNHPSRRLRRALWATAGFLIGFAVVLSVVVFAYLIPAMEEWRSADASRRRALSAYSALLMTVLLITFGLGLVLTFRVHRFFLASRNERTKTRISDAWQEAGKRSKTTPPRDFD